MPFSTCVCKKLIFIKDWEIWELLTLFLLKQSMITRSQKLAKWRFSLLDPEDHLYLKFNRNRCFSDVTSFWGTKYEKLKSKKECFLVLFTNFGKVTTDKLSKKQRQKQTNKTKHKLNKQTCNRSRVSFYYKTAFSYKFKC